MNVHELTLQNYTAASGCPSACQPILYLGTAGSYGNEQINVVLGEGWQGLTVKAVFQPSGVPVVVPDGGGVISVPWEATQSVVAYPNGRISFQGYVSGRLVNTSDVPYTVGGSSAGSDNTPAPTPDEFQQFVDAVKSDADRAAQAAADAEAAAQKVTDAGAAQVQAVKDAGAAQVQAVKDEGEAQTSALDDAAAAHKTELESIASHPPQPNTETGKWQVWNAESGEYQDTDALYQGGYYTPAVSDDGVLTWQGSQAGMPSLPSANVKGPQGPKGDPGLGVPSPTQSDAGKVPTVKADGSAYELAGPYAPLSAAIRPTASGNPVSITDSVEWPLQGLKVYGKSTQDGEPSPENPVPIISAGDGGSVELSVTGANLLNLNDGNYNASSGFTAVVKDGIINVEKASASNTNGAAVSRLDFQPGNFCLSASCDFANNASIFVLSLPGYGIIAKNTLTSGKRTYVAFNVPSPMHCGITISPLQVTEIEAHNVAIQVEHGSVATAYAPYVSQSLSVSTPNGLPGIPVDSGGNYTDAEGQQSACDVKDYGTGKYTQMVGHIESYNGETITTPYMSTTGQLSTGAEVYYVLDEPVVTDISAEELAAYRALHTYDGSTVVSTAEDVAGLEVRYVADAQKYIDNRLTAAEQHIQELAAAQLNAQTGG